jgi:hypothetical protein
MVFAQNPDRAHGSNVAGVVVNSLFERKSPFERLSEVRKRRGVYAQPASQSDIQTLHTMLAQRLDNPIASAETACMVQDACPNSVWSVYGAQGLLGGLAFLPLNNLGLYSLIYGKLNFFSPPLDSLAVGEEKPVVIYIWAVVATGSGIAGFADVMRFLDTPRFRHIDIWAQAITPAGERLAARFGLQRFDHTPAPFFKYSRSPL